MTLTSDTQKSAAPSERTRIKRVHKRAAYDRETLYTILDATPFCHIAYSRDGKPSITPTMHWREGDHVYWHGSSASSALRSQNQLDVCLAVTHIDGIVIARSTFHHSANYRSAIIYGTAHKIDNPDIKREKSKNFIDRIAPDHWQTLRPITDQELKATTFLSLSLEEASAKIRTGGPKDDAEDYDLPIWAGVYPVSLQVGEPVVDEALDESRIAKGAPDHLNRLRRTLFR